MIVIFDEVKSLCLVPLLCSMIVCGMSQVKHPALSLTLNKSFWKRQRRKLIPDSVVGGVLFSVFHSSHNRQRDYYNLAKNAIVGLVQTKL